MRLHVLILSFAVWCAGPLRAQATLSVGDSTRRRIEPHSGDSLYVTLRDGDYAKLIVSHPAGLSVDVVRPSGSELRSVIEPSDQGVHPVSFVAEGAGRYAVVVTNTRDTASLYSVAFKERRPIDEWMRPATWRDTLSSPTITRIRKAIEAGNANTAALWLGAGVPKITFLYVPCGIDLAARHALAPSWRCHRRLRWLAALPGPPL